MIKLFGSTDKSYSSNGDIVLQTAKAKVHKEDNGDFYINVEAPLSENEKSLPASEGTTVTGKNFTLTNVDRFKKVELTQIEGNTTQNGTPTPTSPQPINVVSGRQEVNIVGKNLFLLPNSASKNNVSYTKNENGTFNISTTGTASANSDFSIEVPVDTLINGNYTITTKSIGYQIHISYYNGNSWVSTPIYKNETLTTRTQSISVPSNATRLVFMIRILNGTSINLTNETIMLEKGNTASQWEAYKGQSYEINLGKNLISTNTFESLSSVRMVSEATTGGATVYGIPVEAGQTYTASFDVTVLPSTDYRMQLINSSKATQTQGGADPTNIIERKQITCNQLQRYSVSITTTQAGYLYLRCVPVGFTLDNIQIEKGKATSYAPYKTPIELCKIGDYKDRIYKLDHDSKNLFNKSIDYSYRTNEYITEETTTVGKRLTWTSSSSYTYQFVAYTIMDLTDYVGKTIRFKCDFKASASNTGNYVIGLCDADNSNRIGKATANGISGTTISFEVPEITNQLKYLYVGLYVNSDGMIAQNNYVDYKNIILTIDNEDMSYAPYGTAGTWYIEKQIGKIVLNGTEEWYVNGENTNYGQYGTNTSTTDKAFGITNMISDRFITDISNTKNAIAGRNTLSYIFITIAKSIVSYNVNNFKTWLSNNPTSVYFPLETPTYTEITDTELLSQLNALQLLEGLNNISISSGDLAGEITIHYNYREAQSTKINYIDYLVPNNIIVANTPQGDQAFRISNVENTRSKIKIKAYHVFYDSENYLIKDTFIVNKNCNDALDQLNINTDNTSPYTTISDITKIASYRCVRKSLYEAIQVLLERYGGHLYRDNWTIGIKNSLGQDNGVTIRYGKNLKDIKATYNWDNVCTKLLPVGKDGILLNALDPTASVYLESFTQYDIPYTKSVSFDQNEIVEDDYKDAETGQVDEQAYKQALIDDLTEKGQNYLQTNSIPVVNYTLSANVEKVSDIGDTIQVIDEKLGISLLTNIISYEYDCILDKYTQIEFGNFTPTLSGLMGSINNQIQQTVDESTATLQITLGQELEDATNKIWEALGNSYVIYEGDKILVVDSLPKETATNVIMINNGGIGFSNNGINGTFNSAWTIDNILNMEQINVINLTADIIKGGTLKLGSNLNQNGQIEVYDEANSLIAELNKNGLKMYGVDGSYVLMNNTVGFSGYDRLGNQIYWVSKDEFHMKKSVVEEEITLCNKLRFIPITITDSNNNIVNDGIGLVSVAGGGN